MAVRFDGSTDRLSCEATISDGPVTICGWMYFDTLRSDWTFPFGFDTDGSQWFLIGLDNTNKFSCSSISGTHTATTTAVTGVWYFVAASSNPSGSDLFLLGRSDAANLTSEAVTIVPGASNLDFNIGNDSLGEFLNGRMANVKVWTAALTQAEIECERWSFRPNRTSNLWAWYPLDDANNRDYSGNARALTVAGSISQVNGPPIGYGAPELTMTGAAVPTLTVANSGQAQASQAAGGLTQHYVLAPASSGQAQASQAAGTLTQHYTLTVANSGQAQTSRNVTLGGFGLFATAVSGHYFIDQNGDPWLGVGDTAWSLVGALSDADIELYLDNRAAKGVNLVLLSAPEPYYVANPPQNVDGVLPFTGTAFQSTLNDTYWDRVDLAVSLAEDRGITLLVCPFYLGYPGTFAESDADATDGWATEVVAATNTQMRTYAGYLYARYGSAPNIMWLIGHDRKPGTTLRARAEAFIDEMWNVLGCTHLRTFGGARSRSIAGANDFGVGTEEWGATATTYPPDFDTQYDYSQQIAVNSRTMWGLGLPYIFLEGIYEQEQPGGPLPIGDPLLREQMWAPRANGAAAILFGNNPIWNFEENFYTAYSGTWQSNMDVAGSDDLAAFASINDAIGVDFLATMSADTTSTFVTNQGTGTNRIAAMFGADGGIVYFPDGASGSISVDMTEFAAKWATMKVTRYDPRSGATSVIDASEATTNASFSITTPASTNNSAGETDWLFVVEGLTLQTVTLTVANSAQAQASESVALTQHNTLAGLANSSQSQTAAVAGALTQHNVLAPAGCSQTQTADVTALTQHNVLTGLANSSQGQTAAVAGALTQHNVLTTLAASSQAQTAAVAGALTQHYVLSVANSGQAQTTGNVTLGLPGVLGAQNSSQTQTAASIALTQHNVLAGVADSSQTQSAATVTLTASSPILAVANSTQGQTAADAGALTQHYTLAVASSAQTQTAQQVSFGVSDSVRLGADVVSGLYVGTELASAAYIGDAQVWP